MSTEIINSDDIKIKVYYLCNGNGSCNNSEVCGFNTGDPSDCNLTQNLELLRNKGSLGRISEFTKAFNLVLERFRVQYDTVTNTLMLTEKGV